MKKIILYFCIVTSVFGLYIGEMVKEVVLEGETGGLVVEDQKWDSTSLNGKVSLIFYVDPDEKDLNSKFSQLIEEKNFDQNKFRKVAIINLAATWKPNFVIENILKEKQQKFPHNLYIKDKKSILVDEWKIKDNTSDVILLSPKGEVLFYKDGALSQGDMEIVFTLIDDEMLKIDNFSKK